MAAFCLTKDFTTKFIKGLKSGEIDPVKLSTMKSEQRREFLGKYVGVENTKQVNALFESKLLLKNQQQGMINWAKQVTGIKPALKRDLLSRIEKMDRILDPKEEEQFLRDLATTRLGIDVTQVEAKTIIDLSRNAKDLRAKAKEDFTFNSEEERLSYGMAQLELETYINDLKLQTKRIFFSEQKKAYVANVAREIPGALKSLVSSLDNSFFGRQGIKTLLDMRTSPIWAKNFLKSWKDIGKELKGKDAMSLIKADIYSRPNALNGKYKAGNYGLDVMSEEAYPSTLPEKIPVLRRLYKASESAYNGAALRMRADLADRLIKKAEDQKINTLDKREAEGMGRLIGSMTGRGSLGRGEVLAKDANVLFFSIKFLKSNFDTLTAHQLDSKATAFTKKEAAKNLASMVLTVTTILTIAKMLNPNSVDEDPRSTNFGKIKVFGHWTDITGGMGSMLTLAARSVPTWHNGKLSWWYKNQNGAYTETGLVGYGKMTPMDVIENYFEGKLAPALGVMRDVWNRQTFSGDKPTIKGELANVTIPLSIQSSDKLLKDPQSSFALGSIILEGLGFSTSTNQMSHKKWGDNPTKSQQAFLDKVGKNKFNKANDEFNSSYNSWYEETSSKESYKKLSDEAKQSLTTKSKEDLQIKIFKSYGFKYKNAKKTNSEKEEAKKIKSLLPN